MKKVLFFVEVCLLVLCSVAFAADIPRFINYQGMLTSDTGDPLDGDFDLFFRIYNAPSGGDKRWEENHSVVSVSKGLFNAILGSQSGGIYLDFSEEYWLEIEVNNDTMPERLQFTSVGYAYRSMVADSALTTVPGSGSNWHVDNSVLYTNDYWGIVRGGADNVLYGNQAYSMVNLGVACTTGASGENNVLCTVGGGLGNRAAASYSTVGGGTYNTADSGMATVGGGSTNKASGGYATVGGGGFNTASGHRATVGGGSENTADGYIAIVGGGWLNQANADQATVGGGYSNEATGKWSSVPGGYDNTAQGNFSFAAGRKARANHGGSFVWADSTDGDFSSSSENEFSVRASGGMRMIANNGSYGAFLDNQAGGGDGLRAYSNVSQGTHWGALYAVNYGTSPAIYASASGDLAAYFDGAVYIADSLHVVGHLSKGSGSFKIDHPLDPDNKYLYHSFVESPDMMNVYNGNVVLDGSGEARVDLPEWFETLNRDFRYQLTCIGGFAPVYIAEKISNNRFAIAGGQPGLEVSWQVTGIRQDAFAEKNRIPVEEEKPVEQRGKYLHPKAYDLPETMGINYIDQKEKGR